MIVSNTNHALYDIYSSKNRRSNTPTNNKTEKSDFPRDLTSDENVVPVANVIEFSDSKSSRSSHAFKEYLGYRANHALKQYSDYDNLENKENVDKTLGISVYA